MPVDPTACDKRAEFCERLAADRGTSKASATLLIEIAMAWRQLGRENNSVEHLLRLLDGLGFPSHLTGNGGADPKGDGHA